MHGKHPSDRVNGEQGKWGLHGKFKKEKLRACLVVQWLRHHAPDAGDTGSIPAQGIRSHMPKIPCATKKIKYPTGCKLRPRAAKKMKRNR